MGEVVGCARRDGYLRVNLEGKTYYLHRMAFAFIHDRWPTGFVDHKNGVTGDNRQVNLREANFAQNTHNQKKRSHNTSGVTGVHWHKIAKKWQSSIKVKNKRVYLGLFDSKDSAAEAMNLARKKLHGEFFNEQ